MAKVKYICQNTQNSYDLELWEACPSCVGRECLKKDKGSGPRIPWKTVLQGVVSILLILLLVKFCSERPIENQNFSLGLSIVDSNTAVLFSVSNISYRDQSGCSRESTNGSSQVRLNDIADCYINISGKKTKINNRIKDNKFYLCQKELGALSIIIEPKGSNIINKQSAQFSLPPISVIGNNGFASRFAKCPVEMRFRGVSEIQSNGNINIWLSQHLDTLVKQKKVKVMISINGKSGLYQEKLEWKVCDGQKGNFILDIWGFIDNGTNDTIGFERNGDILSKSICFPPDIRQIEATGQNFRNQINSNFGIVPMKNILSPMFQYDSPGKIRVFFNGRLLSSGMDELDMLLQNEAGDFKSDGRKRMFDVSWQIDPRTGKFADLRVNMQILS
jgi:hypothetical protein